MRNRRWDQFSLRGLVVTVAVIATWLGWWVNSATRQQRVVRMIVDRGGTVEYDYQYDAARNRRVPKGKSSRPLWLQRLLGDDYFHDVVTVGLDVDEASPKGGPTDSDLVHLKQLPELRFLYLGGGHITDEGLIHLKNLTELRLLILWGNPISGAGLRHLRQLKKLQHLDLNNTAVSDDHLTYLKELRGLERIDLANNPQISGSFLQHVANLPKLTDLVLRGSGITDAGLVHLSRAKNLQGLMLDRTRVTDAGLIHLQALSSLGSLDVSDTAVSQTTVDKMQQQWFPRASVTATVPQQPQ